MARKFKSKKKNFGYKNPYKQQEARLNKISDKINRPPANGDQPIPKRQRALHQTSKKQDAKKEKVLHDGLFDTKGLDYAKDGEKSKVKSKLPRLKQGKLETEQDFMRRVQQMVETAKLEAGFKTKYNVDIEKDDDGKVVGWRKREDMVPMIGKRVLSKKKVEERLERKREKNRNKLLKRKWKKKRKEGPDSDEELEALMKHNMFKSDKVDFGEVVHAPPKLTTAHKLEQKRQRKEKETTSQDRGFLFAEALTKNRKNKEKGTDDKARMVREKLLEKERLFAVSAYREIHKQTRSKLGGISNSSSD